MKKSSFVQILKISFCLCMLTGTHVVMSATTNYFKIEALLKEDAYLVTEILDDDGCTTVTTYACCTEMVPAVAQKRLDESPENEHSLISCSEQMEIPWKRKKQIATITSVVIAQNNEDEDEAAAITGDDVSLSFNPETCSLAKNGSRDSKDSNALDLEKMMADKYDDDNKVTNLDTKLLRGRTVWLKSFPCYKHKNSTFYPVFKLTATEEDSTCYTFTVQHDPKLHPNARRLGHIFKVDKNLKKYRFESGWGFNIISEPGLDILSEVTPDIM